MMTTLSHTHRASGPIKGAACALGPFALVCAALIFAGGCSATEKKPDSAKESLTGASTSKLAAKYDAALDDADNLLSRPSSETIPREAREGGTLRRWLSSAPSNFNWLTQNAADVTEIQTYVHDELATRDPNAPTRWIPELAYKVTVSDDGRTYTVHLREDVFWQIPSVNFSDEKFAWLKERRELTAEDCAFTFELLTDPQTQAGALKAYYQDVESVEVIDRHTFAVTWKRKVAHAKAFTLGMFPMPKWLYTRDQSGAPLDAASVAANLHRHWAGQFPVGTGPYRVTEANESHIRLERNANYWNGRPPISTVEYRIYAEHPAAYEAFKKGELDLMEVPAPAYRDEIVAGDESSPFQRGEFEHRVIDRPVYYYLGWNADGPYFSDRRVRQAMTHALDRSKIISEVLAGLGKPISGPILPAHPGNNADIEPLSFDLERAAQLLEQAGWSDSDGDGIRDKLIDGKRRSFIFTMTAYNIESARAYLSVFKEDLRKIGVVMRVQPTGWQLMQKLMDERSFDAFTGGWALGWDVDPFQLWHSTQADVPRGSNRVSFRNDKADQIIEKLRVTTDLDERVALLHEFHALIHQEQPYTFLYQLRSAYAWRPELENVQFQPLRPTDFSLSWYFDSDQASETEQVTEATSSQ